MKRFSLRIGTIEIRETIDKHFYDYEVVKWSPNPLYGKKEDYKAVDKLTGEVSYGKNGITYSESCFAHPESCYVVSFVSWNPNEGWWEVREVGTRPWQLDDASYDDWTKIMKLCMNSDILPQPSDEEERKDEETD